MVCVMFSNRFSRLLLIVLISVTCAVHKVAAAPEAIGAQAQLEAIAADENNPLAGVSLAVMVDNEFIFQGAAGCAQFHERDGQPCRRAMKPQTKARFASVSKMAAAFAALKLADEGLLDLDKDVSEYLGWPLRNPAFPNEAITARHLMAHLSGIRDPDVYWISAPEGMEEFLSGRTDFFDSENGTGGFFTYANLNYGLLGAVMENAAGERFDGIVRTRLLAPGNIDAGFNWSGVSRKGRRLGATLYRQEKGAWAAQTDGGAILKAKGPYFLSADGLKPKKYLASYRPGHNATLFSPQGGLRASAGDLVRLMRSADAWGLLERAAEPLWNYDASTENGDTDGGFFNRYGLGVHTLQGDETAFPTRTFVGHAGEAYGLYSGAWKVTAPGEEDIFFAFAVTGTTTPPAVGAHSGFNAVEEKVAALAMDIAAKAASGERRDDEHPEPRPYDADRNAMQDVDAALLAATANGKRVIVVLGANWCHDSRGLAAKFQQDELQAVVQENYELVYVDVGRRDRNLDVGARFGVPELFGTPTVLVLSANGDVLNADTVHDWRTAYSKPYTDVLRYFETFAP